MYLKGRSYTQRLKDNLKEKLHFIELYEIVLIEVEIPALRVG